MKSSFILDIPPLGEKCALNQKTGGMEWESEAVLNETSLQIVLWCNRRVEGNLWLCEARVEVYVAGSEIESKRAVAERLVRYHKSYREHEFVIPRTLFEEQQRVEIFYEICNVVGYRDPSLYALDFSKPSPISNLCVSFRDCNQKVYINSQMLAIHSQFFAHRFAKTTIEVGVSQRVVSDHGSCVEEEDDFEVMSLRSDMTFGNGAGLEERMVSSYSGSGSRQNYARSSYKNCSTENDDSGFMEIFLEDVDLNDFLVLLEVIYPPGAEITNTNLPTLLSTSYRLGVEHVLFKCEKYLISGEGASSFSILRKLEFAALYKMASLQTECLRKLTTSQDVRNVLEDQKMGEIHDDVRVLLLETLLQRFKIEPVTAKSKQPIEKELGDGEQITGTTNRRRAPENNQVISKSEAASFEKDAQCHSCASYRLTSAILREQLNKEVGMRKNLELSLKCMRDFIKASEERRKAGLAEKCEATFLSELESRIASLEAHSAIGKETPIVSPPFPANRDFLKTLVFDTFDASKLSKSPSITCNGKIYSMYDIYRDIVVEPYVSMEVVTYSFVTHLFVKPYGDKVIPLLLAHMSHKINAFPQALAERVVATIISGYDLEKQLPNDAFLIHELNIALEKHLNKDFAVFCSNMKAACITSS